MLCIAVRDALDGGAAVIAAGLDMALAGAPRADELSVVRATGADIAGVRAAPCRDGRRTQRPGWTGPDSHLTL